MKKFLLLSIIVHALLFMCVSIKSEEVQPKTSKIPIQLQSGDGNSIQGPLKFPDERGDDLCPDYYFGLGYMYNFMGEVTDLSPLGSAKKAGLKLGDVVLNHSAVWDQKDSSVEGMTVYLDVKRGDDMIKITATIEKICTERDNE